MKNKIIILLGFCFVLVFVFSGCKMKGKFGFDQQDKIIVENCRNNWIYKKLQDTITIKLLLMDKKGFYDIESWPNFFIGITNENDTIGLIDDFSNKDYKTNSVLTFAPYDYRTDMDHSPTHLVPVLTIRRKDKENNYYCSVKTLFYAKLIED